MRGMALALSLVILTVCGARAQTVSFKTSDGASVISTALPVGWAIKPTQIHGLGDKSLGFHVDPKRAKVYNPPTSDAVYGPPTDVDFGAGNALEVTPGQPGTVFFANTLGWSQSPQSFIQGLGNATNLKWRWNGSGAEEWGEAFEVGDNEGSGVIIFLREFRFEGASSGVGPWLAIQAQAPKENGGSSAKEDMLQLFPQLQEVPINR